MLLNNITYREKISSVVWTMDDHKDRRVRDVFKLIRDRGSMILLLLYDIIRRRPIIMLL